MAYKINPSMYNDVFVLPTAVVDDNIRLAGSASLKTLLWLARHISDNPAADDISNALGLSLDDVKDALSYWTERGVIVGDSDVPVDKSAKIDSEKKVEKQKDKSATEQKESKPKEDDKLFLRPTKKPTMAEVVKRGNESDEIKFLLNESQRVMGRPLTNNDAETLLWLADYCEMPVSVILMAINFAASRNTADKNTLRMRYIEKIVVSWMESEIFTVESAEKKIEEITQFESRWHKFQSLLGLERRKPTAKEEEICTFIDTFDVPDELIKTAYDETVDKKGKYSSAYMFAILKKWQEQGIRSADDVAKSKQSRLNSNSKATFDIDKYEQEALKGPKLKKR